MPPEKYIGQSHDAYGEEEAPEALPEPGPTEKGHSFHRGKVRRVRKEPARYADSYQSPKRYPLCLHKQRYISPTKTSCPARAPALIKGETPLGVLLLRCGKKMALLLVHGVDGMAARANAL